MDDRDPNPARIPLDLTKLEEHVRTLVAECALRIERALRRGEISSAWTIGGPAMRKHWSRWPILIEKRLRLEVAHGLYRPVQVQLRAHSPETEGSMGEARGLNHISLFLPAAITVQQFLLHQRNLRQHLTLTFIHEITHLVDPGVRHGAEDMPFDVYVNQPHEVRALMQEMSLLLERHFAAEQELLRSGALDPKELMESLFELTLWEDWGPHLTPENQKRVRLALVRHLQERQLWPDLR